MDEACECLVGWKDNKDNKHEEAANGSEIEAKGEGGWEWERGSSGGKWLWAHGSEAQNSAWRRRGQPDAALLASRT